MGLGTALSFLPRSTAPISGAAFGCQKGRVHGLAFAVMTWLTASLANPARSQDPPTHGRDSLERIHLTRRSEVLLPGGVRIRGAAGFGSNYRLIWDASSVWATLQPGRLMTRVCPKLILAVGTAFFVGSSGDLAILDRASRTVMRAYRGGRCTTWFRIPHTPGSLVAAAWRHSELAILVAHPEGGLFLLRSDSLGQRRQLTTSPFRYESNWPFLTANEHGWVAGTHDSPAWRGIDERTGRQWGPNYISDSRQSPGPTIAGRAEYYYGPVVALGPLYLQTRTALSTGRFETLAFDHTGGLIVTRAGSTTMAFIAGVPGDSLVLGLERGAINRLITYARVGAR